MNSKQRKLNNSVKWLIKNSEFTDWSFRRLRITLKRAAKEMKRCGFGTRF